MKEVVLVIPGKDKPGYLRRAMQIAEIQDQMRADELNMGGATLETIKSLVGFLSEFVHGLEGDEARDALLNLSENDLMTALEGFKAQAPKVGSEG